MKRIALTAVLVLAGVAVAQRIDVYDASAVAPDHRVAVIADLPDGGAVLLEVCARLQSVDGGAQIQSCDQVHRELGGANRTTVLNVLDKAATLWANRQSASSSDSGL